MDKWHLCCAARSIDGKIAGAMLRLTLILPLLFAMLVRTAAAQTQVAAVPFVQWEKFVDPNEGSFW
ncbi:MAG TPA: hypothetical protein VGX70_16275, partial [Gemmataceae bacterium]|nr:hypothetical protein [Gemmataceae bacterium]